MLRALVLLGVAASLFLPAASHAQNRLIPFQGKLTAIGGSQIPDGNSSITFRIWDHPTDTAPARLKWTEPRTVFVQDGQVNLMLGTVTSLDSFDFSPPNVYYLGITVGAGTEMAPRQQLVPSFHARVADKASTVADNGVTGAAIQNNTINSTKIIDGAIQNSDIGTGAVTTEKILDGQVGSVDLAANAVTSGKILDGEVKSNDIGTGEVKATNLGQDVRTAVAPLEIHARVTNASAQILNFQNDFRQITLADTGLTLLHGTAKLPCVGQPSAPAGADPCGAANGIIGLTFNAPRAGTYEICADIRFDQGVSSDGPTYRNDVRFLLSQSQTVDANSGGGEDKVFSLGAKVALTAPGVPGASVTNVIQRSEVAYFCRLFSFGASEQTVYLLRLHEGIRKDSSSTGPCCSAPECVCYLQIIYPVALRIREVPSVPVP